MSKLLKKEIIVAKSISDTGVKLSAKTVKRQIIFNDYSEQKDNSNIPLAKNLSPSINEEDIFVSPVLSSFKIKMKVRINGNINPIPVDDEDIVFLDE